MTKSLPVLVNREGGAASAAGPKLKDQITQAFADAGASADVRMLKGKEMAKAIEQAAKAGGRIVVAGGDGTVACAAQVLTGGKTELAVLPLGTLNHLARDLGIPTDLKKAAALAAHGDAVPVDVGEVNGRRFINNASIGLYPFMVRERDTVRDRHGWPKWLATVPAAWQALERLPHHRLRIDIGEGEEPVVTPLLFIGNNRYSLEAGSVGTRETLQDGKLSVYAVAKRGRASLIWFAARTLAGLVDRGADFRALGDCPALEVASTGTSIEIAMDGEVTRLDSPLKFRSVPGGLKIVSGSGKS